MEKITGNDGRKERKMKKGRGSMYEEEEKKWMKERGKIIVECLNRGKDDKGREQIFV